jgi:integrase
MQGKGTPAPRRIRQERGIYYRPTASGKRYEIVFADSTGRTRWQVVEGGLKEARAVRGDILGKLGRGERVVRSNVTFGDFADEWIERQTTLRPRTLDWYRTALRVHLKPRLGRRKLASITEDDVARVIREMTAEGKAAWTVRGVLVPLSRVLGNAARRGLIPANPVKRLERGERPSVARAEMRVLDKAEIGKLVAATPERYRPLVALSVFLGLRQGEALGLRWSEIDFDAGLVRVRLQLGRDGSLVEPKTRAAVREVVLPPFLAKMLKAHKLASPYSGEADFVFASATGQPLHYRNVVRRGLDKGLEAAKLGKLRWHDLRHTAASLLIAEGLNVVYVSRSLGHASPDITLKVYAHLFDRVEHGQRASDAMEASFGAMI